MAIRILTITLMAILLIGQTFAEAATKSKESAPAATQSKEAGDPMDKVSREDVLDRVNGILSHNPQILEMLPEIQKEMKGDKAVFKIDGREMGALSKDELIAVLRKINPSLQKIQQERIKKQGEQIIRQQKQNDQLQRMIRQQGQMKSPTVYVPPANQPSNQQPYRPPAAQPAPSRR